MKNAILYRMDMSTHTCPYGLKAKDLLRRKGYNIDDRTLKTREEVEGVKLELNVKTTPQIIIDEERIGGYDDLRTYFFGKRDPNKKSYFPVAALFALTFLMALGASHVVTTRWFSFLTFEWFIAFSMVSLAYLKIRDIESFSTMFLNYDLLAQKWVPYGYIYPLAEALAGILMVAKVAPIVSGPLALFIGLVGSASVFKAVYVDGRDLKCACVGGDSNVPLGFISLTESLLMTGMGIWVIYQFFY